MFSKIIAVAAIAGLAAAAPQAFNAGDGFVQTVTTFTTQEITVTSCAPTVTDCPNMRVSTTVFPVTAVITPTPGAPNVNNNAIVPSGATGTGGAAGAGNGNTYNVPQPTGGYNGPSFTGAGNKMSAGGAVVAIGAVAALLI